MIIAPLGGFNFSKLRYFLFWVAVLHRGPVSRKRNQQELNIHGKIVSVHAVTYHLESYVNFSK